MEETEREVTDSSSEDEITLEDVMTLDETEIIILGKILSSLGDNPLNQFKKSNSKDSNDKFLRKYLIEKKWQFNDENNERSEQEDNGLNTGDVLNDQFNELDIKSEIINEKE